MQNCTAFTGNNEALFVISNNQLLMTKAAETLNWKGIGKSDSITALAAGKNYFMR
ncbi:hypothetical protein [Pedobacter panaciterrae]